MSNAKKFFTKMTKPLGMNLDSRQLDEIDRIIDEEICSAIDAYCKGLDEAAERGLTGAAQHSYAMNNLEQAKKRNRDWDEGRQAPKNGTPRPE